MKIKEIKISNFRLYKGENSIFFKNGKDGQNISIIAGQNGFGKTTFLTALVWGLYGKLIADVDEKYRKEIYEKGGYNKYADSVLNRDVRRNNAEKKFSVEIELIDVYIPTVPCRSIRINRTFDIETSQEESSIFIDGFENELTKEVGADIFINDFVLPREIAKFFLFDAEKIVSLAEIKTIGEKRSLSKAYSEVLGINKYESLKKNLENLRIKLRKKYASIGDRDKLESLQGEAKQLTELIILNNKRIDQNILDINSNRLQSEQFQEKLIREGNSMSVEDLIAKKKLRDTLIEQGIAIKSKLRDLIDLAPFAIAGKKLVELNKQISIEERSYQNAIDKKFVTDKLLVIKQNLLEQIRSKSFTSKVQSELATLLEVNFKQELQEQTDTAEKILLGLKTEERIEFVSIFDNIKSSYSLLFKQVVKEDKNNRIFLAKTNKKIADTETKDNDVLAKKLKLEKAKVDKRIEDLTSDNNEIHVENGGYQQELATKNKLISELAKRVNLDSLDEKKDIVASRLITELNEFILEFKQDRKTALQERIKKELQRLMHKTNFVQYVEVELIDDLIDIHLLDEDHKIIEKESLSKGEQQLYATALLKALVDESGLQFPVFIDSPLQKFDKKHSKNIITKFYPTISKQVVLFPLLEKELTSLEYKEMLPFVSQSFLIENKVNYSTLQECDAKELFKVIEKMNHV